jgi:hypothetical protein
MIYYSIFLVYLLLVEQNDGCFLSFFFIDFIAVFFYIAKLNSMIPPTNNKRIVSSNLFKEASKQ